MDGLDYETVGIFAHVLTEKGIQDFDASVIKIFFNKGYIPYSF